MVGHEYGVTILHAKINKILMLAVAHPEERRKCGCLSLLIACIMLFMPASLNMCIASDENMISPAVYRSSAVWAIIAIPWFAPVRIWIGYTRLFYFLCGGVILT